MSQVVVIAEDSTGDVMAWGPFRSWEKAEKIQELLWSSGWNRDEGCRIMVQPLSAWKGAAVHAR